MPRRVLLIVALLCVLAGAQTVSLASDHFHGSSEHCCFLCHAGPLPFVQTTAAAWISPFIAAVWLERTAAHTTPTEAPAPTHDSRGPPA